MACHYDRAKFEEFRALAVTDRADIKVGERYYSNTHPEEFVVQKLCTVNEMCDAQGLPHHYSSEDNDAQWIMYKPNDYISMHDHNIGASYNPWLIFKDAATAQRCRDEMPVTISSDW